MSGLTGTLVFDPTSPEDGANTGAYLRMFDNGKLVSYSNITDAAGATFDFVDGDVTVGTDSIAETAHGYETGDIVQLTSTGTLPAGLSLATDYYVIRVDADNIKFAASLADAEAGTAVTITAAAGGGTHTTTKQEREHNAMDVNLVNEIAIRDLDAAQDSIESWTHDGLGTPITSTTGFLDVNVAGVSGMGIYAEDSAHTTADDGQFVFSLRVDDLTAVPASVLAGTEGDYQGFITDAAGALYVAGNQLDIDDLNATDDQVGAWMSDGSGNAITSTTGFLDVNIAGGSLASEYAEDSAHATADVGSFALSVRVDDLTAVPATALAGTELDYQALISDATGGLYVAGNQFDIDDLNATDDAVSAWLSDGSGNSITSTTGFLDVNIASGDLDDDLADTAIENTATSVANSAVNVVATALANRKHLLVANTGPKIVYFGKTGVTIANGFPLANGDKMSVRIGPSVTPQMISGSATASDVRAMELA
jgi:hypothetical protein